MFDASITAAAADFWKRTGIRPTYPRSLEPALFLALPIAVVRLPRLTLHHAIRWLGQREIAHHEDPRDRPLHGYLVARAGVGIVFLDGADPPDELRFSLTHEIAHFMVDYLFPRLAAISAFGDQILDVLDGFRRPTAEERLAGILKGVALGTYSHLGRRSDHGALGVDAIHAEDKADQLALELLAPASSVLSAARTLGTPTDSDAVTALIVDRFGLPSPIARTYTRMVLNALGAGRSFRDWLGP